jgi:hypothetical protein
VTFTHVAPLMANAFRGAPLGEGLPISVDDVMSPSLAARFAQVARFSNFPRSWCGLFPAARAASIVSFLIIAAVFFAIAITSMALHFRPSNRRNPPPFLLALFSPSFWSFFTFFFASVLTTGFIYEFCSRNAPLVLLARDVALASPPPLGFGGVERCVILITNETSPLFKEFFISNSAVNVDAVPMLTNSLSRMGSRFYFFVAYLLISLRAALLTTRVALGAASSFAALTAACFFVARNVPTSTFSFIFVDVL